jgi:hypothetical protein
MHVSIGYHLKDDINKVEYYTMNSITSKVIVEEEKNDSIFQS